MNWLQPWCPLHAPKLLWSRLMKAKVGLKPDQSGPKWDDTGLSVLFEKRMLHLWLVALCVHVVMWSSIRQSSHRYHGETRALLSVDLNQKGFFLLWGIRFYVCSFLAWFSSAVGASPAVAKMDSQQRMCTELQKRGNFHRKCSLYTCCFFFFSNFDFNPEGFFPTNQKKESPMFYNYFWSQNRVVWIILFQGLIFFLNLKD